MSPIFFRVMIQFFNSVLDKMENYFLRKERKCFMVSFYLIMQIF